MEAADRSRYVVGNEAIEEEVMVELRLTVLEIMVVVLVSVLVLVGSPGQEGDPDIVGVVSSSGCSTAAVVVVPEFPAPEETSSEDNEGEVEETATTVPAWLFASTRRVTSMLFFSMLEKMIGMKMINENVLVH